jgi:hypothetical protein
MMNAFFYYMVTAFSLILLASLVSALVLLRSGFDITQPAEPQLTDDGLLLASTVTMILFAIVFVVIVRLAFFLPAVVVSDEGGLERGFSTAKRNTLRILAVLIGVAGPLMVVEFFFQTGIIYAAFGEDGLNGSPAEVMERMNEAAALRPLLWAAYSFVNNIVFMGLVPSTAAFAYLQLKTGRGDAPETTRPPLG